MEVVPCRGNATCLRGCNSMDSCPIYSILSPLDSQGLPSYTLRVSFRGAGPVDDQGVIFGLGDVLF
jgi:hypothetical protein